MRAIEAQIALATPDQPNDLDRLLEGGKRVARLTSRPAVRLNRIPEAAGPRASSNRPPLSTSRLAAAFPSTAGGRSGRFATSGKKPTRVVAAAIAPIKVHVSTKRRWYG